MTQDPRYWIWLQLTMGYQFDVNELIEYFGSAQAVYNSSLKERAGCKLLNKKKIERMESVTIDDADEIVYACRQNNWQIIAYDDNRYPDRLRHIDCPPAVLYVDGRLPDMDRYVAIGVVGTRHASPYAMTATRLLSRGLAECGAIIVSGGALGVDSAGHRGALDSKGVTVAVLGCGLGTRYLSKNDDLRTEISRSGAVITEFVPYTQAGKHTFPMRNRIISGLCNAVLVGEAGERSGSMITANYAIEQGRDVFVLPSSLLDDRFLGCNRLIDQGAMIATSPERILSLYSGRYSTLDISRARTIAQLKNSIVSTGGKAVQLQQEQYSFDTITRDRHTRDLQQQQELSLSGNEKSVFDAMGDEPMYIDVIANKAGVTVSNALISMTLLEMKNLIVAMPGKLYKRKESSICQS